MVATLNIGSGYKDFFSTAPINDGDTAQIDYLAGAPNPTAPAGTTSADSYLWIGPVAGNWNAKANWDDATAGQDPGGAPAGRPTR